MTPTEYKKFRALDNVHEVKGGSKVYVGYRGCKCCKKHSGDNKNYSFKNRNEVNKQI